MGVQELLGIAASTKELNLEPGPHLERIIGSQGEGPESLGSKSLPEATESKNTYLGKQVKVPFYFLTAFQHEALLA